MKFVVCFVVFLSLVHSAISQCPWETPGTRKFSTVYGTTTTSSNVVINEPILLDSANVIVNKINITNGGVLIFNNSAITLQAHIIWVGKGGVLRIGSSSCRVSAKISITLWGPRSTDTEMSDEVDGILMGTKGIGVSSGGAIDVHGLSPKPAWTRLAKHANQNDSSITLRQAVDWKVGDEIVIASTDYPGVYFGGKSTSDPAGFTDPTDKWAPEQNEQRTILAISSDKLTITVAPLNFTHYGLNDMSAEVGLLTRNVRIQGDDTAVNTWMGGHIMVRNAVYARFTGVELYHMGQKGIVGRYPLHFHLMGNTIDPENRYIKDSSVHHLFQRCVVIHTSHGVMVQNNVAYNTQGHCYFLEDGPETFNTFDGNLGILANPIFEVDSDNVGRRIIVADAAPSIFWIVNPNNTVTNNVAVEAQNGFWYALPDAPVGISFNCCAGVTPKSIPLLSFKNNVAHSTGSGLFVDKGIVHGTPAGNVAPKTNYNPGATNPAIFDGFIAYKNRDFGVWTQSENNHVFNAKLYDNKVGARMIAGKNSLQNSLVMIDTDNLGLRLFNRPRSRPQKNDNDMVGWQYYDHGSQSLRNVTFVNFITNSSLYRTAYAIQFPCQPHPHNSFMKLDNIKYVNSAEYRIPNITTCYNTYDNLNAVNVMDVDGSTTGWVGGWIVSNIDLHKYSGCVAMPQWLDAAKCPPTFEGYVRVAINVPLQDVPNITAAAAAEDPNGKMLIVPLEQSGAKPLTLRGDATKATDGQTTNGYNFATNLHNTRTYLVRWLSDYVSSKITLRMGEFQQPGEFVILVFPYPKSATLTFSGSYTRVNSINDLVFPSYFYDAGRELLYVRLSTEEENNGGNPRGNWAQWAHYNAANGITLTIQSNCSDSATWCPAPASNAQGFQVPIPTRREQLFRADLTTCINTSVPTPYRSDISLSGTAYFSYDPRTARLSYHIMHNIGLAVTNMMVQYQETPGGPVSTELVLPALPVSPVKGFTYLTQTSHKKLTEGKLRIVFGTNSNPNGVLSGYFGCVGSCSVPEPTVAVPACDAVPANSTVDLYINGNFTKTFPLAWISGSVGTVSPSDGETPGVCGGKPIKSNLGSSSTLNIGMNGGTPFNLEEKYKFLEFWIKAVMPANGQVDLFVTMSPTPASAGKVRITKAYIDNHAISAQWTRVRIPLSDFNVTSTIQFRYIQFSMVYPNNARPVYYFDQIRFSSVVYPNPNPVTPPTVVAYVPNKCDVVPTETSTTGEPNNDKKGSAAFKVEPWLYVVLVALGALVF